MLKRNHSLDSLRGIAILLMILSGSIAFNGVLPAWMYHAQVPPPTHTFNPELPGITWVDLVFPFFLFSMGVAIPLSLRKFNGIPNATIRVWWVAARRFMLLAWFALFSYHMRAWVIAETPDAQAYWLSIAGFLLLFGQFYEPPANSSHQKLFAGLRIAAFGMGLVLLWALPFNKGEGFRFAKNDIIIMVLGNMAFFGSIAWWHTRNNQLARLGILPVVMAIFMAGKTEGSWTAWLFNLTPLPWLYTFYFLKYLFIIIPGTIVGDWLLAEKNEVAIEPGQQQAAFLLLALIVLNTWMLFSRLLVANLLVTTAIIGLVYYLLRQYRQTLLFRLFAMGSYLLLLGLCFEAWEGGIKKDPSTYSYYFVTTGLACFLLVFFYGIAQNRTGNAISVYLAANGKNPMVAYVAGNLLLTPFLFLTQLQPLLNNLNRTPASGFLKGVIFTAAVSAITWFFTRKKWFWKS